MSPMWISSMGLGAVWCTNFFATYIMGSLKGLCSLNWNTQNCTRHITPRRAKLCWIIINSFLSTHRVHLIMWVHYALCRNLLQSKASTGVLSHMMPFITTVRCALKFVYLYLQLQCGVAFIFLHSYLCIYIFAFIFVYLYLQPQCGVHWYLCICV